ncbi:MAG: ribosome small subunit-dependent GTPase A [Coriobacteriales bacterium]|nr:ribosome small subunit-dependent GTPase A [Coriobacteriales bacterium]
MAKRNSRDRRNVRRKVQKKAERISEGLPSLELLTELPEFGQLRQTDEQMRAYVAYCADAEKPQDLALGCVVRLDRGYPAVLTQDETFRAEFAAQLTKSEFSRVAVGDWVAVRTPHGHDMGLIEKILPRKSDIARWKGGSRGEKQTLAANVDVVLVVQALEKGRFSLNRIVRSAVVAADCGAGVAVILTKCDLVDKSDVDEALGCVRDVLGEGCPVVAISSVNAGSAELDGVRAMVPKGSVGIMLGPSGAGKSTLLNALLGREALETGSVRESDGVGRHTTVARRMVAIPEAGVIVDEPGLRTLQMVGHERGLAKVFPDIAEAARGCRFRNCTHTHEPGCEVRARFGGDSNSVRLGAYLALANEMRDSAKTLDPDIVL